MMAYNVLLAASGAKKKTDDSGLLEKVTGAYKRWQDRLVLAVREAMPKDVPYCVTHDESLIGLFSCIFVKQSERAAFDDVSVTSIKRGMGGWYGNKVWSLNLLHSFFLFNFFIIADREGSFRVL